MRIHLKYKHSNTISVSPSSSSLFLPFLNCKLGVLMGNRGHKRSETVDELPADKRTCSSLEFRPSSSMSPVETPSTSTNQTHDHDHDMETSSSASGSGRTDEDKDSAYGSCDSEETGDADQRRQRHAILDYQRQRLSSDQAKFKRVLSNLSEETEESAQQEALRELCEILSFCTDSSLSSLIADSLSPILIKLASHESNPEIMLLSIRALTYLCDIHPQSSALIIRHDGVTALCKRLLAFEYEDVAEQCLQALEKISREQPLACLQSGAIMAVLTFIDFFSTSLQRVALSTVVNICVKLPSEGSSPFMDAVPVLCKLLQYEDNQLVEHVATCLIKIAERVQESSEMLDELSKHGLIHQVAHLIDLNSHTTLSHSVHTGLIGLLVKLASGSMVAVKTLFDLNISSILKEILSIYDLSHGVPSPRTIDGHYNQMHEVLKLLIQLLPVVSRNQEVPLAAEKEAFLVTHPDLVEKFENDLLPVLIQVVDSGVDLYICYGCLSVVDKLLYYSNSDMLLDLLKSTNISRFLAGVFTRKDIHVLMLALNISDTILQKNTDVFMGPFVKEGVLFAIDALIDPEKCSQFMFSMFNDIQLSNTSSKKYAGKDVIRCLCFSFDVSKSSSSSESRKCKLELECVRTLAKHIRTNYFDTNSSTSETGMTPILEKLKSLSSELSSMMTQEGYDHVLHQIMSILNGRDVISTFEFVESGIADSLVNYLSSGECSRVDAFGRLFLSCTNQPFDYFSLSGFISKLQSALSSVEDFPVVLNNSFKHRNSYATVPRRHSTTYPCLRVLFVKEEGESTLTEYTGDVQTVDPFSDFEAIETFLWPKVCLNNAQSPSDKSQHDVGQSQTSPQKPSEDASSSPKLSFYLEGKEIDRGLTIYQAVLSQHISEYDTVNGLLWNQLHKITFKKSLTLEKSSSPSEIGSAVEKSTPCHNLLFLLRILESANECRFHLMTRERIEAFSEGKIGNLDDVKATNEGILVNEFVNTRLTEKLEQQMRDPLAISTGGMPSWCTQLMTSCPFLFSFEARWKYFKLVALGKHQGQNGQNDAPMPRKKFLVYRNQILESASKMMDLHANQKVVLEVKYDEEVGTGLGPTLEFFTLVSNEFQKPGMGMWRGDTSGIGIVNSVPFGLFPSPLRNSITDVNKKFVLLGQVVAKALHDGRVLDIPFSKAFYKLILGKELTVYDIQSFDAGLGKTLIEFQALVERKKNLERFGKNSEFEFRGSKIQDLHLDFTLPGYPDYILASGPDKEMVNMMNLENYIELVVDATINSGIMKQMEAFKSGFNQVFPIKNLKIFTDEELERLLCGESETWNSNQLSDLIKFDHGYTASSPPIIHFLEVIQEFDYEQQKAFVKFVTGAPRLPIGGLASLNPKLTIVRKLCDKVVDADLPSVMTCANYLKLPPYSSKEMMKEKLLYAITEGQGSFHLS
ncbi:unnamed protein product [Lactuca virosa]|uniref:HECT-type E3 ubiquitin transferase n=1 Tax=Lactuca virosa TaxID=75947 RepID=A0AAU9NVX9_9ASTR|nr:unnamed protein product [Lactuca virosa]